MGDFRLCVLVSGGGTNLQAIIDRIADGSLPGVSISRVISNNQDAYALKRAEAAGIEAVCVSRKDHPDAGDFNRALLDAIKKSTRVAASNIVLSFKLMLVELLLLFRFFII